MPARLVLLASGSGTTLQAIVDALGDDVVAAGTDRPGCAAMTRAETAGIPTFAVPLELAAAADPVTARTDWNWRLAREIARFEPELVVLAGFMRILAPELVNQFTIVNTHPSLLPSFPGAHAVRDALAYGVKVSGVTVHWVDGGIDTGPVIAQAAVPVEPDDDEAALQARIQATEKPLYVNTLKTLIKEIPR